MRNRLGASLQETEESTVLSEQHTAQKSSSWPQAFVRGKLCGWSPVLITSSGTRNRDFSSVLLEIQKLTVYQIAHRHKTAGLDNRGPSSLAGAAESLSAASAQHDSRFAAEMPLLSHASGSMPGCLQTNSTQI